MKRRKPITQGLAKSQPVIASFTAGRSRDRAALVAPLSERERNVLQLIARGYSNKEISAALGISTKTVETYKARGIEKLGLTSRVAIVRYALEQGWLL